MSRGNTKYSEQEIIRGCIANERKFQEMLYRQHFNVMLAMVHKFTRDEEKVLDILNQGFLRVFKKIETYSGAGSFQGWIRRIVYHSISDHFRKESKYMHFIVLEDAEKPSEKNALDNLYYEDLLDIVNSLPERCGEVFKLYAIEGYSHKEIGERLKISAGTSKWHLSQARDQLKGLITRHMKQQYAG
jgi:RNA polymerase sigma-70 factor (ECF subfamily)